ncbi:MAG: hypothetical protein ACOC8A_01235, partial [bacterium]
MVAQRVREELMAKVGGLVEKILEWWGCGEKDEPLYVVEHKGLEAGRQVARMVVQALVDASGRGWCGTRHVDGHGVERVFKGYVKKRYQTIVGPVTVRSAMYYRKG